MIDHYERTGELCPGAPPWPAQGRPSPKEGGVDRWACTGFDAPALHHLTRNFTYHYNAGGNYLGPARGGPDPGTNGFEVAALRDLDGDGHASLITVVGEIRLSNGALVRSEVFAVGE